MLWSVHVSVMISAGQCYVLYFVQGRLTWMYYCAGATVHCCTRGSGVSGLTPVCLRPVLTAGPAPPVALAPRAAVVPAGAVPRAALSTPALPTPAARTVRVQLRVTAASGAAAAETSRA